jgi:hypothetical protein
MGKNAKDEIARIGRELFGPDLIECLTLRECWLIDTYGHLLNDHYYPVPGLYTGTISPALRSEVEAAVDRHAWMAAQWGEALAAFEANKNNSTRDNLKSCSLADYKNHWDVVVEKTKIWPSDAEDEAWAKRQNYSTPSVRDRRKEHIAALPIELREIVQKGGRRRPLPESYLATIFARQVAAK